MLTNRANGNVTCPLCCAHIAPPFIPPLVSHIDVYGRNPSSIPFPNQMDLILSYPMHLQAKFAEHQLHHFLPGFLFGYLSQQVGCWWYEPIFTPKASSVCARSELSKIASLI